MYYIILHNQDNLTRIFCDWFISYCFNKYIY